MKCVNAGSVLAIFLPLSFSLAAMAAAQDAIPAVTYPTIPATAATANAFVPTGWKLETQATGDLNGDGAEDIALVLLDQDSNNVLKIDGTTFDSNPRILVVALADGQRGYRLAASNHTLISRPDNRNQDDKLVGIKILKGTLRVALQNFMTMGGWTVNNYTYTFRLRKGTFNLIGYERTDTARNTGEVETLSVNYATVRYSTEKGNIENNKTTIRWHRLPAAGSPITLAQVGDGMDFQPPGISD